MKSFRAECDGIVRFIDNENNEIGHIDIDYYPNKKIALQEFSKIVFNLMSQGFIMENQKETVEWFVDKN